MGPTVTPSDLCLATRRCRKRDADHGSRLSIFYRRRCHTGEVVTAKTRARLLSAIPIAPAGNRIVLLDLPCESLPYYFEGDIQPAHLSAKSLALAAARRLGGDRFVLASADVGGVKHEELKSKPDPAAPTRRCRRERLRMDTNIGRKGMANQMETPELGVLVGANKLPGILTVPKDAQGVVLFAHGSGSSRLSPRNRYVAGVLHGSGIATLQFDLLDEQEADDRRKVFDIEQLAERLEGAAAWTRERADWRDVPIGYFGASTGAAAALVAAARQPESIGAVVSRGGRPDLAEPYLSRVKAPTLLIVGGKDEPVIEMNREALDLLRCEKRLEIVPGATHLFAEAGALEEVARLAADWFQHHLVRVKIAT